MKSSLYLHGMDLGLKKVIAKKAKEKNTKMTRLIQTILAKHFKVKIKG